MLKLWQKSLKDSFSQGLFVICFMHFLIFCWRRAIVGVFRVLFLHDFLWQLMRRNIPLTHLLPSEVQQFLSSVNSDTYWSLISGEGLLHSHYISANYDLTTSVTYESPVRVYLSMRGFPSFCVYTICLSIHSPAIQTARRFYSRVFQLDWMSLFLCVFCDKNMM